MIQLYKNGAWLINGTELVEDSPEAKAQIQQKYDKVVPGKEEAGKNTIAYSILQAHNTSDNMEDLKIKFDKLTSHDITFVGIIQTARASGLERFPIPYVLTNCHNSLCAVGGTINEINSYFFCQKCISSQNFAYFCTENVYLLVRDIQISIKTILGNRWYNIDRRLITYVY